MGESIVYGKKEEDILVKEIWTATFMVFSAIEQK